MSLIGKIWESMPIDSDRRNNYPYVASSWRNQYFPDVVWKLREYGHEVYDFRNPPHNHGAFMWKDVEGFMNIVVDTVCQSHRFSLV